MCTGTLLKANTAKRVIRDHIHNLSDVWNNVHAIVKQLADTMSATMVKEPKVD